MSQQPQTLRSEQTHLNSVPYRDVSHCWPQARYPPQDYFAMEVALSPATASDPLVPHVEALLALSLKVIWECSDFHFGFVGLPRTDYAA